MKKIIALIMCAIMFLHVPADCSAGIAVRKNDVQITEDSITVDFSFGELQLEMGEYGQVVSLDELEKMNDSGMPNLPSKAVSILLPAGTEVESVSVEKSGEKIYKNILVEPAQPVYTTGMGKIENIEVIYNEAVYRNGQTYPMAAWKNGNESEVRGYHIYTMVLHPVSYRKGNVYAAKNMRVTLHLKDSDNSVTYIPTEEDEEFLSEDIENMSAVFSYYKKSYTLHGTTGTEQVQPVSLLGEGKTDYVIITDAALAAEFQKLADYKITKGLTAKVVSTADIYANYTGRDAAEQIRNFIIDAYQKNHIKYVLLGGDADRRNTIVPTRELYCPAVMSDVTTEIAADMYFACLDGNYDGDNDNIFGEETDGENGGEVDLTYDVYVGRAPVDNAKEAANFVTKTINYEKREVEGKVTLVGEVLEGNTEGCTVDLASRLQSVSDADVMADNIRAVRDNCIADKYVDLYYDANDFIKNVFINDMGLLLELSGLLVRYNKVLRDYASTGTSSCVLSENDVKELESFCDELAIAVEQSDEIYDKKEVIVEELDYMANYIVQKANCNLGAVVKKSHYYKTAQTSGSYAAANYIFGGDYMDEIKDGAKTKQNGKSFNTKGFPDTYVKNVLYDRDQDNYNWKKSKVIDVMNHSPEVINHLGHCDVNRLMKCKISDIEKLTNKKSFFLYSQGCYPGAFDNKKANGDDTSKDCIAETLLLASDTSGAYACIVNSRYGWYSRTGTDGPSQAFNRYFWDRVFSAKEENRHIGLMLARSKQYFIEYLTGYEASVVMRFCYYEQNLLGDPEALLYPNAKKVTVSAKKVKLNIGSTLTVEKGKKMTVKAFAYPLTTTDKIKWKTTKASTVTISKKGVLKAKKSGVAKIMAVASSGKKAVVKVNVVASASTKSVKLNKKSLSVKRGKSATLKATISGSSKGKKWYSTDINVATVSSSGKVKGVGKGICTIYCRTADGKQAKCKVKVTLPDIKKKS